MKEKLQKWMEKYPAIIDLKYKAKKRMPRVAWEYLDSGTGNENLVSRNTEDFQKIMLVPRFLKGSFKPDLSTKLFGKKYPAPFGISPVGLSSLMWPKAEILLAQSATRYGLPYGLSTLAGETPETMKPFLKNNGFFQLYPPRGKEMRDDLMKRVADTGFDTLLVTADVPTPARRERSNRAKLSMPPKINLDFVWQGIKNPLWTSSTLLAGLPRLKTMEKYANSKDLGKLVAFLGEKIEGSFSWDYLKEVRDRWQGKLVLKGILHPDEAEQAKKIGLDGVMVSNHGGRQFDAAPSTITALPLIAKKLKGKIPILFDSGVRSGLDIIKALVLGADFVFLGRPFIYGVAALGKFGGDLVNEILLADLHTNLMQMGVKNIAELKKFPYEIV